MWVKAARSEADMISAGRPIQRDILGLCECGTNGWDSSRFCGETRPSEWQVVMFFLGRDSADRSSSATKTV